MKLMVDTKESLLLPCFQFAFVLRFAVGIQIRLLGLRCHSKAMSCADVKIIKDGIMVGHAIIYHTTIKCEYPSALRNEL